MPHIFFSWNQTQTKSSSIQQGKGESIWHHHQSPFLLKEHPSVSLARPPVGWHNTVWQFPHTTTVWEWLNTVVLKQNTQKLIIKKKIEKPNKKYAKGSTLNNSHVEAALTLHVLQKINNEDYEKSGKIKKKNQQRFEIFNTLPWRRSWETARDAWACASSSRAPPEGSANQYRWEEPNKETLIWVTENKLKIQRERLRSDRFNSPFLWEI